MTDPTESIPSAEDADREWTDDSEEVTVLTVPESSLPKAAVPARRGGSEEGPGKAAAGLRIEPRVFAPSPDREDGDEPGALVINRLGEGIVRLESGRETLVEPKESRRPVMQKREPGKKPRDEELGESWGGTKKHSVKWMLWGGAGVIVAIVGGWSIQSFLTAQAPVELEKTGYSAIEVVNDIVPTEDVTAYFSENAGEVDQQMREVLASYAQARTVEEIVPLVRNGHALRVLLRKQWKPWNAPKGWVPAAESLTGYTSVGRFPYGSMTGVGPDYTSFQVYFVRQDNRMVVDWEATSAYCDPAFSTLMEPAVREAVVRVVVSPTSYHNVAFPESDYAAYRLSYPGNDDLIWGYVRKGTPAFSAMEALFSSGAILVEQKGDQNLKLRIARGPEGAMPNQWLIVDVLHKGWVSP